MEFDELKVARNPKCSVCGANPSIKTLLAGNYQLNHVCEQRQKNDTSCQKEKCVNFLSSTSIPFPFPLYSFYPLCKADRTTVSFH